MKAVLRTGKANQRVPANAEFYFYFERKGAGLSNTGAFAGFMAGASSANEFVLVTMKHDKNERTLILGEFSMWGANSGTRSEDQVDFKIEKLASGVYKVVTVAPLKPGEYAIFYAAGAAALGANTTGKVFDFGVDR
jgi:hypothetical protein